MADATDTDRSTAAQGRAPRMTAVAPTRPRTGLFTKLAYGLGSVAYGVKDNGFQALLLLFYNQVLGLSPYLGGLAILLALAVDSVLDPLVGFISDNWRSRWGRRHLPELRPDPCV